jgi:anti-sigma factor RsiW
MNGPGPTPCPLWEEKLAALHPDDLTPLERKALKKHILSCTACEAVLADYYKMHDLIRKSIIPRRPPEIWKLFM